MLRATSNAGKRCKGMCVITCGQDAMSGHGKWSRNLMRVKGMKEGKGSLTKDPSQRETPPT
eukprot:1546209-Amphidinium_carterae.1